MKRRLAAFLIIGFSLINFSYATHSRPEFEVENATRQTNYSHLFTGESYNSLYSDITIRVTLSPAHEELEWIIKNAKEINKISLPSNSGSVSSPKFITDPEYEGRGTTTVTAYVTSSYKDTDLESGKIDKGRAFLGVSTITIPKQNIGKVKVRFKGFEAVTGDPVLTWVINFNDMYEEAQYVRYGRILSQLKS